MADSRQQTADSRQQTADSRQQTADSINQYYSDRGNVEWVALGEVATLRRGRVMSKEYFVDNIGMYPVYSSQTVSDGKIGSIDSFDFDGEFISWTTDGANAGTVFYREGKFSITNVCGLVKVNNDLLNCKYLYYWLTIEAKKHVYSGMGNPKLMSHKVAKIPVPIPPLEVQQEIARILDAFTALTNELTTELNMRKKQYKHYQFEMLQFTEATQYLSIGECCDIKKGLTPIKKATPGKYPLVATTEERQSSFEYQFDCAAVCVPLISSRGHGVASIDRIYFQDGKFALGNILCAIIPNDSRVLSAKFLRHYLFDKKDVLLIPLMRGGANVSLTVDSLKKVKIPIPPLKVQQEIVRILDNFDTLSHSISEGLPREIELRKKQYAYYRDLLLNFPK